MQQSKKIQQSIKMKYDFNKENSFNCLDSRFMNSLQQQPNSKQTNLRKAIGEQYQGSNSISNNIKNQRPSVSKQRKKLSFNMQNNEKDQCNHSNSDFSSVIDYLNAKYQGKLEQSSNSKINKISKSGPGILIDDQMNFLFSNWKNNNLSNKTVLINRFSNFIYGNWAQQSKSPQGQVFLKINHYYILIKFSQVKESMKQKMEILRQNKQMLSQNKQILRQNKALLQNQRTSKQYKWNMIHQDSEGVMIVLDEKTYSVLVLKGKMQQSSVQFKSSKQHPLSVAQFTHFPPTNNNFQQDIDDQGSFYSLNQKQPKRNIQHIIHFYASKYNFKIQNYELSISHYLNQITNQIHHKFTKSEEFAVNVSKRLIKSLFFNSHQSNQEQKEKKREKSYENQIQRRVEKEGLIYQEFTIGSAKKKQKCNYFGYRNGLGISFYDCNSKLQNMCKQKRFILKSLGNHNALMKIQDIGLKVYQNKCIQQGNFKSKQTLTYENSLFRPTNKISSIYSKYHKKQVMFANHYFDKTQHSIFRILSLFQKFIEDHIIYIMDECLNQTTKFHLKSEKNQLMQRLYNNHTSRSKSNNQMSRSKGNISMNRGKSTNQVKQLQKKTKKEQFNQKSSKPKPNYVIQIQRKNKSSVYKSSQHQQIKSQEQPLNALKTKNCELKQKIKKIKYEIQYQAPTNQIVVSDDKLMNKIRKHLYSVNLQQQRNSTSRYKQFNQSGNKYSMNNKQKLTRSKQKLSKSKQKITKIKQKLTKPQQKLLKSKQKILKFKQMQKTSNLRKNIQNTKNPNKNDYLQDQIQNSRQKKANLKNLQIEQQKSQEQKLLEHINHNIIFKQIFNDGIQYNIHNESIYQGKKRKSPPKNKYNGRNRVYTDQQLDEVVSKGLHSFQQISASPSPVTHRNKVKTKSQCHNYIHSNKKRNQNNEEQKFKIQKKTEDSIRAQILGIPLQLYQNRQQVIKQKQKYLEQNLFQIKQQSSFVECSAHFVNQGNQFENRKSKMREQLGQSSIKKNERSFKNSISFRDSLSRQIYAQSYTQRLQQHNRPQLKNQFILPRKSVEYLQKSRQKQQSLIKKRMRILQQFKQLNQNTQLNPNNQTNQNYANNQYECNNFNHINNADIAYLNNYAQLKSQSKLTSFYHNRMPLYQQREKKDISSPFKAKSSFFLQQQIPSFERRKISQNIQSRQDEIYNRMQIHNDYEASKSKYSVSQDNYLGDYSKDNKMNRKYQYYFDG